MNPQRDSAFHCACPGFIRSILHIWSVFYSASLRIGSIPDRMDGKHSRELPEAPGGRGLYPQKEAHCKKISGGCRGILVHHNSRISGHQLSDQKVGNLLGDLALRGSYLGGYLCNFVSFKKIKTIITGRIYI